MEPFRDRLKQAAARAGVEYSQTEIARSLGMGLGPTTPPRFSKKAYAT